MKKVMKILGAMVVGILLAAGAGALYVFGALPKSEPAPQITVVSTPALLERGEYLSNHVTGCVYCHSMRNATYYSEPLVAGTEGQGSVFIKDPAFGVLVSPNITPAALKDWSDGEVLRALISGVNREGKALFPIMPYREYARMSREDLYSIIAYIRTLESKKSDDLPQTTLKFPLSLVVRTFPRPNAVQENPADNQGEYLATIAGCHGCHTPQNDRGVKVPGMDFAGGMEYQLSEGSIVRSVNITPDNETGIGKWSREQFISTFKRFNSDPLRRIPVEKGNTTMPWTIYSGMKEEDLGAIYDYLRTVKPVNQKIENKFE